jgi:hypothetical protein
VKDFLTDLQLHWNDGYWWADRQWLQALLLAVIATVAFGIRLWMQHRWGIDDGGR